MSTDQPVPSADQQRLELASRLREAREYLGMSQEEVAAALQISRPAVSNIEAGSRKIEAVELDKLGKLYGTTVDFLLTGQTETSDSRVAFLARATQGLSKGDLNELERFASFLRNSKKTNNRGE